MADEKSSEFMVYADDPCLGQKAPSLASLKFHNGDAFDVGAGKVTVITFFSKLNKSDFSTLSVLSEVATSEEYKDKVQFVGISRDGEERDVVRWFEKFQDKHMAELQAPDGSAGVTVSAKFPLAFDEESKVNKAYKDVAKKAVVGVGFTFIVDKEGVIRWYEQFVRGVNPMGQFHDQLKNIVEGTPLISNGNMPEIEEEEVEGGDGIIPVDADPFAGGGGY
mmetsp:Transcript_15315/g.17329  ORF Transcript_15315/g.17329 Transcript_15315/m.17329 type:complete len:221 (+) Transcript_15315:64-726(+)|eukprot:CAMPEP_0184015948 /NCGR_PEP_ID=MMETSP0954-20121128/6641_1 /TAXON_ID=627963 /ORGANISM="Aplanochytrium sp, Strain PBS07" /LENGTH=220 /DNA_ID=CAMNT_0026296883 /DNA_START=115 /DNA_END=777 /DNA_ORIENTATION=+